MEEEEEATKCDIGNRNLVPISGDKERGKGGSTSLFGNLTESPPGEKSKCPGLD